MANQQHNSATGANLHTLIRWTVADAAARLALSVAASDIGKLCLQSDTGACYILTATTPTWLGILVLNTDGSGLTWTTNNQVASVLAIATFVNAVASGLTPHADCQCATTTVLPAGTYNNGAAGVGATFTVTATGTLTIDGHLTVLNDRVLVKNQVSGLQNGVYKVTTAGAVGVQAVLTRDTDSDSGAALLNALYAIIFGTTNASTQWYVTNSTAPTIGTDAITFAQFTSGGSQGNGVKVVAPLDKSGNTLGLGNIAGLTAKTSFVDADLFVEADSAAGNVAKKITGANVKAALKAYFDTIYATVSLESLDADYATATALPAGTYTAQTYLATATGAVTVDGHVLIAGDRVLDKDNATAANRGLWTVTVAGAGGVALAMTRSQGMQQANEFYGALVIVLNGTANAGTFWKETAVVVTVGVDTVAFSQFNPAITDPVLLALSQVGSSTATAAAQRAAFGANAYDIGFFVAGKPAASQVILEFIATRSVTLPASLTGSQAKAGTASTGTATFDIQVNGVSKGSMVFTTSATGTFTFSSQVVLAAADVLTVIAPGSADATLSDVRATFAGTY